jgi:hypothetical protein
MRLNTRVACATKQASALFGGQEDLANKKTFLEDNSQHPRKLTI